jgi:poly(3-hydroxybutyrate) depolymerase
MKAGIYQILFLLVVSFVFSNSSQAQQLNINGFTLNQSSVYVDGNKRVFHYYVPKNVTSKSSLVIFYHGGNGTGAAMAEVTRLHEKADENNFVVIYPNGAKDPVKNLQFWNDGRSETSHL